jgi:NAD(P)H-flavin reductase
VENLDRPHVVAAGCARLGPALAELGVPPQRLESLGLLMSEAMRASGAGWRPGHEAAWRSTVELATRWMVQGAAAARYEPAFWTGVVVSRDEPAPGTAVLRVRTYLPYPHLPGQHAEVEPGARPQAWSPCWLGGAPRGDNVVELHADAADGQGAEALARRTAVGDQVRLRPAAGGAPLVPPDDGELLLVAAGTGLAPAAALLAEVRSRGDRRPAHLVLLGGGPAPACDGATTVLPTEADGLADALATVATRDASAYVAGPPTAVAAVRAALAVAGFPTDRIRCDTLPKES